MRLLGKKERKADIMKKVKIVVGANYGDEGKGLLTRHFAVDAIQNHQTSVIVMSNGTAQRGHTVDYDLKTRHVYHHFGSGTADGVPTFYANTFWIHPMEFVREWVELVKTMKVFPKVYCDENAHVITPFDMLADHMTMAWIAHQRGEREYGTCGYGGWCAIETRGPQWAPPIWAYRGTDEEIRKILEHTWSQCIGVMVQRGVDIEALSEYKEYFVPNSWKKEQMIINFIKDVRFFLSQASIVDFDHVYNKYDNIIFENGQGLGLDMDVDNDWHTTSKTGIIYPRILLRDKQDFTAEVCYVTRSYLTRHGVGPLEEAVNKSEINADMHDKTNVPNEFQGALRYGYLEDKEQAKRIADDWSLVDGDRRFTKEMAITHCNEFEDLYKKAKYVSYTPYSVIER